MAMKPALSIPDQIDILRRRGMLIDDERMANNFLQSNHYYRLNIYFHKFMDSTDHYQKGVEFSRIMAVYENDRWLRNRMLSVLEPVEIKIRTQLSHYLALTHGSDAFYQPGIFKDRAKYLELFENFSSEITRNQRDPVIVHHQSKYEGLFPIWVVVEFFSFNTLSKLYKNLLESDKKAIAKNCNGINDYLLGQWLHVLSVHRNICAHYGYLYRREYPLRPIIARTFHWDPSRDNRLFAVFLVMRRLSDHEVWQRFIQEISNEAKRRPFFQLEDYGFPPDWKSFLC